MKLKGKAAIISGAGRGFGRAIAEGYACGGASLVLTTVREKKELDEAAELLNALGVLADVSEEEDVDNFLVGLIRFKKEDLLMVYFGAGLKK
jgi:gluconate 5-dehydrogenase